MIKRVMFSQAEKGFEKFVELWEGGEGFMEAYEAGLASMNKRLYMMEVVDYNYLVDVEIGNYGVINPLPKDGATGAYKRADPNITSTSIVSNYHKAKQFEGFTFADAKEPNQRLDLTGRD